MEENYKLPKLNLLVIGKTGVGKSTLLNSLFGKNLALTGSGEPYYAGYRQICAGRLAHRHL